MNLTLFFAAMWHSEAWYEHWRITGSLYSKARALVLHDRVLTGVDPLFSPKMEVK